MLRALGILGDFFSISQTESTVSLEDMIVLSIKRVGRFPKAIDMSGTLKKKNIKIF